MSSCSGGSDNRTQDTEGLADDAGSIILAESHLDEIAERFGIISNARLPIDPALAAACDKGRIETLTVDWLDCIGDMLEGL